ncbi:MAG: sugar phosphate isomerase/epimerase [Methanocorpusculum sp.]|nr:sugar phosphate isomerase/epimerase [Methanocorpusculum sp.]
MNFGVSSNCLMNLPLADALNKLSEITYLVEIQCDAAHSLFSHEKDARDFDLRYTIHSPTGDGNIACGFEPMRKASIEVIAETAKIADRISAEKLVIHPGFCLEKSEWNNSLNAFRRSLTDLGKLQKDYSVKFVMENLGNLECCLFRFSDALPLIKNAGLGFCLDAGHANLNGNLDEFLKYSPEHFHLHDNHGTSDEHAACGSGEINFREILKKKGTFIIEVINFDDAVSSIYYLSSL